MKINMKKYKIKQKDIETITESLVFLNRKSIEKIFVQTYILLLEWSNDTELDSSLLNTIFSKLGESRIDDLKYLVHQYQKGEGTLEEIYSLNDMKTIENKTKLKVKKHFSINMNPSQVIEKGLLICLMPNPN